MHVKDQPIPLLSGVMVLLLATLFFTGEQVSRWCQYDRAAILHGEWWRIFTAHFIHFGWGHLTINVMGFLLVLYLFREQRSVGRWLMGIAGCSLGTGLGLLIFSPKVDWYLGFSGTGHGLLALGIIDALGRNRRLAIIAASLLLAKLLSEMFGGPSLSTERFINTTVVTASHLYGAMTGLAVGMALRFRKGSHTVG